MSHIRYFRIDERLIHGQILQKWLKFTGCSHILVIDDETAKDPIIQSVLEMTLPGNMNVLFLNVLDGVTQLSKMQEDCFVLMKNLETLQQVFEQGADIEQVNICRLPYFPGKKKIYHNLFISDEEEMILKKLMKQKIDVYIQMVPDAEKIYAVDLLK